MGAILTDEISVAERNDMLAEQAWNDDRARRDYEMDQLCLYAMSVFPGTPGRHELERYIDDRDRLKTTDQEVVQKATQYLLSRIGQCVDEFEGKEEPMPF